ncbi:MAG: hypothetical protein RR022_02700 [Angelakisella sp.]
MNLKDGMITIGEILAYPPARELLLREFPALARHPMLHMAGRITLNTAIAMAGDALSAAKKREILDKLRAV